MLRNYSFQKNIIALLFCSVVIGFPVQTKAANAPLLMVDLSVCAAIEHLSNRLACFDDLAQRQALAGAANSDTDDAIKTVVVETPVAEPVTTVPIEEISEGEVVTSSDRDIQEFGRARIEIKEDNSEEFQDQVTNIKMLTLNKREITLSSGQVWQQMVSKRLLLREDDVVRIRKIGNRKNYQLSVVGRSGFIQVRRSK